MAVLQCIREEGLSFWRVAALFAICRFGIITAWERAFKKGGMAGLVSHQIACHGGPQREQAEPSSQPYHDETQTR